MTWNFKKKKCIICNKEYLPTGSNDKCCSIECIEEKDKRWFNEWIKKPGIKEYLKEYSLNYQKSPRYRKSLRKYYHSEKGRNTIKKYRKTDRYKELHKIWTNKPENKIKARNKRMLYLYGISLDDFNKLLNNNPRCQICQKTWTDIKKPFADHNHKTKKFRGILCRNCNNILGHCYDNIDILKNAIRYLEEK